jgi:transcriptional regulator with XRE-family HTH domain
MKSLAEVIAENVRALRDDAGLTQADLATRLRTVYGLDWSRNTVAYVESGRTEPTLSELLVLADALDVSVLHLVEHRGRVALSSGSVQNVTDVVLGRAPLPQLPQKDFGRSGTTWRDLMISAASVGEAERHFAKTHGLDAEDVARLAFDLWKKSLTDERDERAGANAPRMKKAHVTRKLGEELLDRARQEGLLK